MRAAQIVFGVCLMLPAAAYGQSTPFSLYVHDTTGQLPDTPLPTTYQFGSTAVGASSPLVIKMVNTSSDTVYFGAALVGTSSSTADLDSNFSVTGEFEDQLMVPGTSVLFTVNFAPTATGVITGYLNLAFQVEQNGCVFSGSGGPICPAELVGVSTLTGTATSPQLILSYESGSGSTVLTPSSSSPLNFPNTSLSSTSTITFTLTNSSSLDLTTPAISLSTLSTTTPDAFALDTSTVPSTIAAGQSANFNVTFAPSQSGLASANLNVGSNTFPIQGEGIIVATIDALDISYVNSTGIRTLPQAATPISFGQVLPGSGASAVLTFTVANPTILANSVTVPAITVTGTGFTLSGLPTTPVTITPGNSITFAAAFTPGGAGTYTGSLSIASRTFSLTGVSLASALPSFTININGTLASQQQPTLSVQFSQPAPVSALGTITMSFQPSVTNVTDDAAVLFLATGGRVLNISLAAGAQTATYNNQSSIAFQTGTTAGTITFTVAFPDTTTYTQSFTIPEAAPQLTSVTATREDPNLLINVNGFDNLYSVSQLSFTFYDPTGKVIGSPITYNAQSDFSQLFFTNNTDGGLFALSATFPVQTGSVTQVGSVTVGVTNSLAQSTASAAFQ